MTFSLVRKVPIAELATHAGISSFGLRNVKVAP